MAKRRAKGKSGAAKAENQANGAMLDGRDEVLPKLLSGEIRVGQAEKIVEEVA